MTAPAIEPYVQHLHQFAWQPGARMHADWWSHLGLAEWRSGYQRHAACRPSIDKLILKRRHFSWKALPGALNAEQQCVLALESRFTELIISLGVVALNCPDHLLMKHTRQSLMPHLDEHRCDQLLALHRCWSLTEQALPPEALKGAALSIGTLWWLRDSNHCPVKDLLAMRLPPIPAAPFKASGNAGSWLIKIGRFL